MRVFLLFVNDAEAEVDFVGLFEFCMEKSDGTHGRGRRLTWICIDDTCESFFCMFQAAIAIVKNANAVPQLRLVLSVAILISHCTGIKESLADLCIWNVMYRLLITCIGFLKIVDHEIAMP